MAKAKLSEESRNLLAAVRAKGSIVGLKWRGPSPQGMARVIQKSQRLSQLGIKRRDAFRILQEFVADDHFVILNHSADHEAETARQIRRELMAQSTPFFGQRGVGEKVRAIVNARVDDPRMAIRVHASLMAMNGKFPKHSKIRDEESFYRSKQWQVLRYEALRLYGARCQCCGRTAHDGIVIHVDHIKPRSTHPELELDINNLQVLCEPCNKGKMDWDETDWRPRATA